MPTTLKPTSKIRPKLDGALLNQLHKRAWEAEYARRVPLARLQAAGELAADWLLARFPQSDMRVLERYDHTELLTSLGVRVFDAEGNSGGFMRGVDLPLPFPVLIPSNLGPIYGGGRRFSNEPTYGIHQHVWDDWSAETREQHIAATKQREAGSLPEQLDPLFHDVARYQQELLASSSKLAKLGSAPFPRGADKRTEMLWADLAPEFPVLGAYLTEHCFVTQK